MQMLAGQLAGQLAVAVVARTHYAGNEEADRSLDDLGKTSQRRWKKSYRPGLILPQ